MDFIIKRMHSEEELKERILGISREDLERSIAKGQAIIRNGRISRIKKSIQESFEETKRLEELSHLIREQDFSTLKQIDALMRGNHINTMINVDNFTPSAVDLYVAIVKKVYLKTLTKCQREYACDELRTIAKGWNAFNQDLTTTTSKKTKLDLAEQAMNVLQTTNDKAVTRIANEANAPKIRILAN